MLGKKQKNNQKNKKIKKKKVVLVSGGFDPIHIGHIRLIQEAKKLGDKLVVVINNDNWLISKKGKPFMHQDDRKEIIQAISGVDEVCFTEHPEDMDYCDLVQKSICESLRKIKPDVFANGGDRHPEGDPIPEVAVCKELGIKLIYNVGQGGKVRSSSDLVNDYQHHLKSKNKRKKLGKN